uniref:Phosphoenolpyruvate carboxylase kinase n=1 Tax=Tetraselmis sp. GSL018 TaxID=582737 RepID=A0A061RWZ0_9CHLO
MLAASNTECLTGTRLRTMRAHRTSCGRCAFKRSDSTTTVEIGKVTRREQSRTLYESPDCPLDLRQDPKKPFVSLSEFEIVSEISATRLYSISKAKHKLSKNEFTFKVFLKPRLTLTERRQLTIQLKAHTKLKHPNILKLYTIFEESDVICLVFEPTSGDTLLKYASSHSGADVEEDKVASIVTDVLQALEHLHAFGIAPNKVELDSFVYTNSGVKLVNFGTLCNSAENCGSCGQVAECTSFEHEPSGKGRNSSDLKQDTGADLWSVGILVWELLTGTISSTWKRSTSEQKGTSCKTITIPASVSVPAWDFVAAATDRDPDICLSAKSLLQHKWLASEIRRRLEKGTCRSRVEEQTGTTCRLPSWSDKSSVPYSRSRSCVLCRQASASPTFQTETGQSAACFGSLKGYQIKCHSGNAPYSTLARELFPSLSQAKQNASVGYIGVRSSENVSSRLCGDCNNWKSSGYPCSVAQNTVPKASYRPMAHMLKEDVQRFTRNSNKETAMPNKTKFKRTSSCSQHHRFSFIPNSDAC